LGCARNDVDSDELAGVLAQDGWSVVPDAAGADIVVVNTCGFIDAAKSESIATILDHADGPPVVATGCMAERYGVELAAQLPEAAAVLGFDHYPVLGPVLRDVLAGRPVQAHRPRDRRTLLPISPAARPTGSGPVVPGHRPLPPGPATDAQLGGAADRITRRRLVGGPVAALKIASGCDRRCAFCAIPSFRGAFLSRRPEDVVAEAEALVADGVREVVLVSENSTSYGKDLPGGVRLEQLLGLLAAVPGLVRIRVSYLQPAEVRPSLLDAMAGLPAVAPSYDLSFQHASAPLLRRMRRFGGSEAFLDLVEGIRQRTPEAGFRTNVILGFPGETEHDVAVLADFLSTARLDAVGVFEYSDEEGTEAARLEPKVDPDLAAHRAGSIRELADAVAADRAQERIGSTTEVLLADGPGAGRAPFQGPEDGGCRWAAAPPAFPAGAVVPVRVVGSDGVDLLVAPLAAPGPSHDRRRA
jgi:MiaB/RimO family radical SAM methylthiotransferase